MPETSEAVALELAKLIADKGQGTTRDNFSQGAFLATYKACIAAVREGSAGYDLRKLVE